MHIIARFKRGWHCFFHSFAVVWKGAKRKLSVEELHLGMDGYGKQKELLFIACSCGECFWLKEELRDQKCKP